MKTPHFELSHSFIEFYSPFGEKENVLCDLHFTRDEMRRMAYHYLKEFAKEWWPEHKDDYPTLKDFLYACWFRCGYNYSVSMKE